MRQSIIQVISKALRLPSPSVAKVIELLAEGNTIPFLARYRKEATGNLDEVQLRQIKAEYERYSALEDRRETVLRTIADQGKLDQVLKGKIEAADTLTELEDLYLPYRPKRRTRATIAREQGLEPLAEMILTQPAGQIDLTRLASEYISDQRPDVGEVLQGARDIVAEIINDHAGVRQICREKAFQWGQFTSKRIPSATDDRRTYERYYQFAQRINRVYPHQVLAINRGEREKVLRVQVELAERDWRGGIFTFFKIHPDSLLADELSLAVEDTASRLLLPAIERDIRRTLTEAADKHAINVFAENLRALLSQPPVTGYTVLGIDPGYRTGSKLAVVDPTGKVLTTGTIYPHPPQNQHETAFSRIKNLVADYQVKLIAIGNGTASRETELLVAELTRQEKGLSYLIVSEAGASVYSASELAREELPDLDVTLRGAVSIARRVQDPLAELVKIDPKSIGIGLYQHDVNQVALSRALLEVVESVVNQVGVDINTASPAILQYISGIGPKLAQKIVQHRDQQGEFPDREALKTVRGLGPKVFEQAVGFLRIRNGKQPLDNSAIHPESYAAAEKILAQAGISMKMPMSERSARLEKFVNGQTKEEIALELGLGTATLEDILFQIRLPGRDPREDLQKPILRQDVLKMEDLTPGMHLAGTVRNVVDFGAFIDIGVKQDGLLHRSQLPPHERLSVGDIVQVVIQKIEIERGRISLGWRK